MLIDDVVDIAVSSVVAVSVLVLSRLEAESRLVLLDRIDLSRDSSCLYCCILASSYLFAIFCLPPKTVVVEAAVVVAIIDADVARSLAATSEDTVSTAAAAAVSSGDTSEFWDIFAVKPRIIFEQGRC